MTQEQMQSASFLPPHLPQDRAAVPGRGGGARAWVRAWLAAQEMVARSAAAAIVVAAHGQRCTSLEGALHDDELVRRARDGGRGGRRHCSPRSAAREVHALPGVTAASPPSSNSGITSSHVALLIITYNSRHLCRSGATELIWSSAVSRTPPPTSSNAPVTGCTPDGGNEESDDDACIIEPHGRLLWRKLTLRCCYSQARLSGPARCGLRTPFRVQLLGAH